MQYWHQVSLLGNTWTFFVLCVGWLIAKEDEIMSRHWGTNLRIEKPWLAQCLGPDVLLISLPTFLFCMLLRKWGIHPALT